MNKNTNKKKNTESTFGLEIDTTKVTLIRHFMAEKGYDSDQFDKEFTVQVGKLVDKMYRKYVPTDVRKLYDTPAFTITANPNVVPAQADTKESVENDTDDEQGNS